MLSLLAVIMAGQPAFASVTGFDPGKRKTMVYKTSFNDVSEHTNSRLDWRNPSTEFAFDIPESAWIEDLELMISGLPIGHIDPDKTISVQFNNAEPIILEPGPHQFDARVKLDRSYVRTNNNKIRFTYGSRTPDMCATPSDGAWDMDFNSSFIVIKSKSRLRAIQVKDLRTILKSSALAPKKIAIIAEGPEATKLKALAAQGISLNMETVPVFKSKRSGADMEIIIARRQSLPGKIKDEYAMRETGPKMVISEGFPLQIVITGDNDAEVMNMAKSFASYDMPSVRRRSAGAGAFQIRKPFSLIRKKLEGRMPLGEVSPITFSENWGVRPQIITFDIPDPAISYGKTVVKYSVASSVHKDSTVTVSLNGRILGRTKLDARRKFVEYDIPRGLLQGIANELVITPDLTPAVSTGHCGIMKNIPGFSIESGSYIDIQTDRHAALTDLSRFAASGFPFAEGFGQGTHVRLTGSQSADLDAGLRVIGQLALASRTGWTEADFSQAGEADKPGGNMIIIGPSIQGFDEYLYQAPRSFRSAINYVNGRRGTYRRTAALQTGSAVNLLSVREQGAHRIKGGVATIYSNNQNGGTVGVITTMPGQSFTRSVDYLIQEKHWNRMEGSVAKWDRTDILMTQTALPAQFYASSHPKAPIESVRRVMPTIKAPTFETPEFIKQIKFDTGLYLYNQSDRIHEFWDDVRFGDVFPKDGNAKPRTKPRFNWPEFRLPERRKPPAPAPSWQYSQPVNPESLSLPALRKAQADEPVFISAPAIQAPAAVPPIQLRGPQSGPSSMVTLTPAAVTTRNGKGLIGKTLSGWQSKTDKFLKRHLAGSNDGSFLTFWAALLSVFLIGLSLAMPSQRN